MASSSSPAAPPGEVAPSAAALQSIHRLWLDTISAYRIGQTTTARRLCESIRELAEADQELSATELAVRLSDISRVNSALLTIREIHTVSAEREQQHTRLPVLLSEVKGLLRHLCAINGPLLLSLQTSFVEAWLLLACSQAPRCVHTVILAVCRATCCESVHQLPLLVETDAHFWDQHSARYATILIRSLQRALDSVLRQHWAPELLHAMLSLVLLAATAYATVLSPPAGVHSSALLLCARLQETAVAWAATCRPPTTDDGHTARQASHAQRGCSTIPQTLRDTVYAARFLSVRLWLQDTTLSISSGLPMPTDATPRQWCHPVNETLELSLRAYVALRSGHWEEASRLGELCGSFDALTVAGIAHASLGRYHCALRLFRRAMEVSSDQPRFLLQTVLNLSTLYQERGDCAEAAYMLQLALNVPADRSSVLSAPIAAIHTLPLDRISLEGDTPRTFTTSSSSWSSSDVSSCDVHVRAPAASIPIPRLLVLRRLADHLLELEHYERAVDVLTQALGELSTLSSTPHHQAPPPPPPPPSTDTWTASAANAVQPTQSAQPTSSAHSASVRSATSPCTLRSTSDTRTSASDTLRSTSDTHTSASDPFRSTSTSVPQSSPSPHSCAPTTTTDRTPHVLCVRSIYADLVFALLQCGRHTHALHVCEAVLRREPHNVAMLLYRLDALLCLDADQAELDRAMTVLLSTRAPEPAQLRSGRSSDTVAEQRALAHLRALCRNNASLTCICAGNETAAEDHLREALALEPTSEIALYNLALLLLSQARRAEATAIWSVYSPADSGQAGVASSPELVVEAPYYPAHVSGHLSPSLKQLLSYELGQ